MKQSNYAQIGLAFIIGGLIFGILGYSIRPDKDVTVIATSPSPSSVVSQQSSVPTPLTVGTKTYVNNKYNYRFDYPADWNVDGYKAPDQSDTILTLVSKDLDKTVKEIAKEGQTAGDFSPTLRIIYYPDIQTLAKSTQKIQKDYNNLIDYFSEQRKSLGISDGDEDDLYQPIGTMIGKYRGYKVAEPNIGGINYYYLEHQGHIYQFVVEQTSFDQGGGSAIFDSFAFTIE